MSALVIDIETAGEDWSKIDRPTQQFLLERQKNRSEDGSDVAETVRSNLGLSPYTGQIVAIGMYDVAAKKGAVYFQAPQGSTKDFSEADIKFQVMTESEMLTKFWEVASKYTEFVTFSGRNFDLPFLMIRSAINNIRPSKDLMRGRYANQQPSNAVSIDLYDQLTFYGSYRFATGGGLHMACRAFGIDSPKNGEIDGIMVSPYFYDGKYTEIARYNSRDIVATAELYRRWKEYLLF